MDRKNKKYLYEDDAPVTKYMKNKIRRLESANNLTEECVGEEVSSETEIPEIVVSYNMEMNLISEPSVSCTAHKRHDDLQETLPELIFTPHPELSKSFEDPTSSSCTIADDYRNCSKSLEYSLEDTVCKSFNEPLRDFEIMLEDTLFSDDEETLENLKKSNIKHKSLEELKHDESFLKPVDAYVDKSSGELLLMALQFSLKNNHSFTSLRGLCQYVNFICGKSVLPESRYMIDKLCNSNDDTILHSVCTMCSKYIGTFQTVQKIVKCDNCKMNVDISNPSNLCYFAILNPSNSIRDYLELNEEFYDYVIKERAREKSLIKDIYDGKMYRNFIKNVFDSDKYNYVSVTLNSDGAPVFKSSRFSIWPIYLCINEMPIQNRLNSVIVSGLWYGKNKPDMSIFLEKFTEMLNNLSDSGVKCTIKGDLRCVKVYVILACVDSIARAPMQGCCQFNAHYGCNWCKHPGEYYNGSMRYPYEGQLSDNRDVTTTIQFAKLALQTGKPVFGIKTASPLLTLKNFDIIKSFTPDYMHSILVGVAKQYTEYIINYLSQSEYEYIDNQLSKIKVPHQLGRLTRLLSDRGDWKSREWENWVLYYSVPLLTEVLKSKTKLNHFMLLSESLHIGLQTEITYEEINRLNEMLHKFVSQAENLYDLSALTYNTHLLLHIGESIYNWGPLWAHSAFCFESANYYLLRAIKNAKGVIQQVIRYINLQRSLQILEKIVYPKCLSNVEQFYNNLNYSRTKKVFKLSDITYLGKEKSIEQIECEQYNVSKTTKVFGRLIKDRILYMSSSKLNDRSCNYYIQLVNGQFVEIVKFLVDAEKNCELTVYKLINVMYHQNSNFINEVVCIQDETAVVETRDIKRPAVFIKTQRKMYIIATPNSFFY